MSFHLDNAKESAARLSLYAYLNWQRPVRLGRVVDLLAIKGGPPIQLARTRLEAEELDIDAFLRELDSWAESEDHQPAVVQARA